MSEKPLPSAIEQTIDEQLDIVRTILFDDYRQKILDIEVKSINNQDEIDRINAEIASLSHIVELNRNVHIENNITDLTSRAIQSDPSGMANALGVIMGLAIHAQVENDREEIVGIMGEILADVTEHQVKVNKDALAEALYPVIFPAVTAAVRDAIRSLQRQIDARLKESTQRILDLRHRLTGVSRSDAIFRNALPFTIEEIFFIQNGSGLLIDHYSATAQSVDSDLISAMLTAIRDFASDAFNTNQSNGTGPAEMMQEQLNEIHYANRTIIIKSGLEGYCAVVIDGTEPLNLRERLQQLVFNVHDAHGVALSHYTGNPDTVPILSADFQQFINDVDNVIDKDDQESSESVSTKEQSNRTVLFSVLLFVLFITLLVMQLWINYKVITQLG